MKLPNGFPKSVYDKGGVGMNPYTGAEYQLNNIELTVFDTFVEILTLRDRLSPDEMGTTKGLEYDYSIAYLAVWFRENNRKLFDEFIHNSSVDWDEGILTFEELSGNWEHK